MFSGVEITNQVAIEALLSVLVLSLASIVAELHRTRKLIEKVLIPSIEDRIERLSTQNAINSKLVDDEEARVVLVKYVLSEAALQQTLQSISAKIANSKEELEAKAISKEAKPKGGWTSVSNWFKKHGKVITEKLVGKLNDLVKDVLPGSNKGK